MRDVQDAIALDREALKIREQTFGPDSRLVGLSLNHLGADLLQLARVKDAVGNLLPGRLVDWAISDSTVASIRPGFGQDRVVTAVAAGIAKIAAMVDGKSDTTVVVVR